jgi:hypothetical protein
VAERSPTRHGPPTALALEFGRAGGTVTLDGGAALLDLLTSIALDQGDPEPLA